MDATVFPGGGDTQAASVLDAGEIRLLAETDVDKLRAFSLSSRLHAVDARGETPLHIAARCGKLALCDLFIRNGADARARNNIGQTPAEVAASEGHTALSQLLMALELDRMTEDRAAPSGSGQSADSADGSVSMQAEVIAEPADTLWFEADEEAEAFHYRNASGEVVERSIYRSTYSGGGKDDAPDWHVDLSQAQVTGDAIDRRLAASTTRIQDGEFLVVRGKGRKSAKLAVLPVGTRLEVDAAYCRSWAREALQMHRVPASDIEALVTSCSGNGDADDLRNAIERILEIAGIERQDGDDPAALDSPSAVEEDDLADALEAALTRNTRLPGAGRFLMDRSDEDLLINPMLQIKGSLHVALLGSDDAIRVILRFIEMVLTGKLRPELLTLLTVFPDRENDPGCVVLSEVADTLRSSTGGGAAPEGKKRRVAVQALDRLDLSAVFFKALGRYLGEQPGQGETASAILNLIAELEVTTDRLIIAHLPYVRRFASRNVEEGEDLEDVFQVAFMGLQRSTRRFDPERGHRFLMYATYWMRQALTRWRSDEGAIIRIPVHRHSDLSALDEAVDRLGQSLDRTPASTELAADLEWSSEQVERVLKIPRVLVDMEDVAPDWLSVPAGQEDFLEMTEMRRAIAELLKELPERDVDIVRKRFGFDASGEMTLEEIGNLYGVTRERIRQIESRALRQLSNPARVRRLRALLGA